MDSFFERAKAFAEEAAKKSQELASQSVKYSQEFAQETAKYSQELTHGNALQDFAKKSQDFASESFRRSKELASEAATKLPELAQKAAQSTEAGFSQLVKELKGPSAEEIQAATGQVSIPGNKGAITEEELQRYGITEELREFVRGLTLDTFKDFPVHDDDLAGLTKSSSDGVPDSPAKADSEISEEVSIAPPTAQAQKDLTDWQARHALLVLQSVSEISMFRYKLCPRVMKERRFWQVYFLLVHSHVLPYEEKAAQEAADGVQDRSTSASPAASSTEPKQSSFAFFSAAAASVAAATAAAAAALPSSLSNMSVSSTGTQPADTGAAQGNAVSTAELKGNTAGSAAGNTTAAAATESTKEAEKTGDADIDALLMDALGDDAADGDDDDGAFDDDEFDDLVNSAMEDDD